MNCAVHTQTQAVAYCRTCGKALCEDCRRDVMGAIYCEPCIAARLQGHAAPGPTVAPPVPGMPGTPRPALAGFLGLIPGVGAMYNGQFTKALAHVVIFVMLIIATDRISEIFGVLIAFFIAYMAFEAYKTAEAKRHGLPPPDPLGLDKMFGLQESQHHVAETTAPGNVAYPPVQPVQVEPPPPPQDSAPTGAIILIGLGILFLLSNIGMFRLNGERLVPLFLIGLGLWIGYKRTTRQVCQCTRCQTRGMMGPAVLLTLGVLFLLQSYGAVYFDHSFPVLFLVIGCVLLISRTGSTEGHIERGWIPGAIPAPPQQTPQAWTTGTVPPPSQSTPGADKPASSSGQNDTQVKP
jgi:hypothetical protein